MIRKPFASAVLATAIFGMMAPMVPVQAQVPAVAASNTVQSWTSVVEPDGATTLAIRFATRFDGNMANFSGPNGDYVAFDFPNYSVGDLARNMGVAQGIVKGVRFVETGKRLRAIVQIERGAQHKAFVQDGVLIVRFSNNLGVPLEAKPVTIPTVASIKLPPTTVAPVVSMPPPASPVAARVSTPTPIGSSATPASPAATPTSPRNLEGGPSVVQPQSAPVAISGLISLRDIEYKKINNDAGQLLLDLSDAGVKVKVYREGMNLAIELPNTSLPRNLAKRLRVDNMDTPVVAISPSIPREGFTKLTLEMRGGWDYTFAQNNNSISVDVFKIGDDYKVGGKKVFTGKKISLSFQQIDVRTVLQIIAEFTGLNIIASDTVNGNITLRLTEVPWDQALDIILSSRDLDMRRTGQVVMIAPRAELATRERTEMSERKAMEGIEPLITETFQLNYQKVKDMVQLLGGTGSGGASASGSGSGGTGDSGGGASSSSATVVTANRMVIRSDERTGQLFISATAGQMEEIRRMIKQVDIPIRQVTIEAKIVEVSDTFAKNIGVKFGLDGATLNLGSGNGLLLGSTVGGNSSMFGGQANGAGGSSSPSLNVNLPGGGINGANPGSFAFTLFNSSLTKFLNLEVSALEADGKAKTISSPRVVTSDGKEATISQGTEIPYLQASSSGAANVAFKPATMELRVVPRITPDGRVTLELDVKKDSVGQNTTAGPAIDTKKVQTAVLVENGGTIVIGGIFTVTDTNVENKVPVLGDIPFVGNAFKNRSKEISKKEMVIMITPRIIEQGATAQ